MAQIESRLGQIPRDGTVVIYCRSGGRSRRAIEELQRVHGFTNLVNLRGGILAWSDEIDPELPKY
jgi:adenylyltransferase/sulfurtransferase